MIEYIITYYYYTSLMIINRFQTTIMMVVLTNTRFWPTQSWPRNTFNQRVLDSRGVLGDGLGTLRNGVLRELARENKADSRLDLA